MKIQFSIITGRFASNPFIVMFSYSLHFRSPTIIFSFWLIRVVAKKYTEQQPITSNSNLRQATKRDIGSYHNDRDAITANIHFVLSLIEHFPVFSPVSLYLPFISLPPMLSRSLFNLSHCCRIHFHCFTPLDPIFTQPLPIVYRRAAGSLLKLF